MKKNGQTSFFYESKISPFILLFMVLEFLILSLVAIPFSSFVVLNCADFYFFNGTKLYVLTMLYVCSISFLFSLRYIKKIRNMKGYFIQITDLDIVFEEKKFCWNEISKVTLENKGSEYIELYLKIESGKIPYLINLKYMNDCERRLLLNEIEKYKVVSYTRCSYERNYVLEERICWILGWLMANVVLVFFVFQAIKEGYLLLC